MIEIRDKILFFGIPLFVLFIIVVVIVQKIRCKPFTESVKKNIELMSSPNTISSIVMKKVNNSFFYKEMKDSLFIDDKELIEQIRFCLTNIKSESYQHPITQWKYIMRLNFVNGEVMPVVVNKMDNGKHFTAYVDLYEGCESEYFNYSDSLLVLLNQTMHKK